MAGIKNYDAKHNETLSTDNEQFKCGYGIVVIVWHRII